MGQISRRWWLFMTLILGIAAGVNAQQTEKKKKVVHTLGDSTMAPYDPAATETRGWGMYFGNFLTNDWESINYAKGGRDSRGGYNELWQLAAPNVNEGDYVLIQFAHNDGKYDGADNLLLQEYYTAKGDATNAAAVKKDGRGTTPATTYKECLKKIVEAAKAKKANPVLVAPICRDGWTGNSVRRSARHDLGDNYAIVVKEGDNLVYKTGQSLPADDKTMDYVYHMEQLAKELSVPFIDMTSATAQLYEGYGPTECYNVLFNKHELENGLDKLDHTHLNTTGALLVARLCAQLLKENGILAESINVPVDLTVAPAALDMGNGYLGKTAVKELTLNGFGLDPVTGSINIVASEGMAISFDKNNWMSSLSVDYENGTIVKNLYVRMALDAVGTKTGTVTATLGSKTVNVPVTVNVVELGGGEPFAVKWALSANDDAEVTGKASASAMTLAGLEKRSNNADKGALVAPTVAGDWIKAEDDSPNQYVQMTVTAPDGMKLDISNISMKIGGQGGGGVMCHAYFSTDGFATRTTLYAPQSMASGVMNEVNSEVVASLAEGEQLQIRIYPWYRSDASGKWLCVSDVIVSGQAKDAAGVNITGSISYALSKGTLDQGDDAIFNPEELGACFAGKTWSFAGSSDITFSAANFRGKSGNTPMTLINNGSGSTLSASPDKNNTLTLTLTPDDGFTFVPSNVSFEAGKFGTDGPKMTLEAEAGENKITLLSSVDINRDNKKVDNVLLDPSKFSEAIDGLTATADAPLKLHFSFISVGATKQAGIANVVVDGQLVGAAAQVTKYMLNTQVLPSAEAGSISVSPDLEQYKENTVVTLKANKNFGFAFKGWEDGNGTPLGADPTLEVTMDAAKDIKAIFSEVPVYSVSAITTNDADFDGMGSVTIEPNDHNGKFEAGSVITVVANESKIVKFLSWADGLQNAGASATREITVNSNMTLVADYEVQDFVAVFDATNSQAYAYNGGYPFPADITWDANRNASATVVKQSDGTPLKGQSTGTPVVRNRVKSGVSSALSGVFMNGFNTAEIAWQYKFSTVGFKSVVFNADMAAKNGATKAWKAQYSVDGTSFTDLKSWELAANAVTPISLELPAAADEKEAVYVRIMGVGDVLLSTQYAFDQGECEGLNYSVHSESQVGNVYVLGEAIVADDDVAPELVKVIPADNATGVSASGTVTVSFNERIQSAGSADEVTLNGKALKPEWSKSSVSFAYNNLDYNTQYTFAMPAGYVQDKSGNKCAQAISVTFTTMDRPTVTKGLYDRVVSNAEELKAAITAANERENTSERFRIFVKKGVYKLPTGNLKKFSHTGSDGTVFFEGELPDPITYVTAPNISFIGEDRDATIITQDISNDDEMLFDGQFGKAHKYEQIANSAVLQLQASATGTYFQDITIKSGINDALGRNLAVLDNSSNTIYKNTYLYGYQDTWTSNKQDGLYYFEDGAVRGRTDYLCGKGDAFFRNVELRQIAGGYAAVPSTPKAIGWVFMGCVINGEEGAVKYGQAPTSANDVNGSFTLGRPWGKGTPKAFFIDTKMNAQPKVIGWDEMSNGWPARFAEYNSLSASGNIIDLTGRKTVFADSHENNPVLTAEEAAELTDMSKMFGDWQPALATEQAPEVKDVKVEGNVLSWTGNDYSFCYAICVDGQVIDFTTECTYELPAGATAVAVRAANGMGGLNKAVASDSDTAIDFVDAASADVVAVEYYAIDGKRIAAPERGINMVRVLMSDGSVSSYKVIKR